MTFLSYTTVFWFILAVVLFAVATQQPNSDVPSTPLIGAIISAAVAIALGCIYGLITLLHNWL